MVVRHVGRPGMASRGGRLDARHTICKNPRDPMERRSPRSSRRARLHAVSSSTRCNAVQAMTDGGGERLRRGVDGIGSVQEEPAPGALESGDIFDALERVERNERRPGHASPYLLRPMARHHADADGVPELPGSRLAPGEQVAGGPGVRCVDAAFPSEEVPFADARGYPAGGAPDAEGATGPEGDVFQEPEDSRARLDTAQPVMPASQAWRGAGAGVKGRHVERVRPRETSPVPNTVSAEIETRSVRLRRAFLEVAAAAGILVGSIAIASFSRSDQSALNRRLLEAQDGAQPSRSLETTIRPADAALATPTPARAAAPSSCATLAAPAAPSPSACGEQVAVPFRAPASARGPCGG
jgi:hypothetical protein